MHLSAKSERFIPSTIQLLVPENLDLVKDVQVGRLLVHGTANGLSYGLRITETTTIYEVYK